jgi:hypothetical protein
VTQSGGVECFGPTLRLLYALLALNWNFGDGSTGTGATPSRQFKAGTYNVKLTATNSCGGSTTATRQVKVDDKAAILSEKLKKSIKLKRRSESSPRAGTGAIAPSRPIFT